MYFIEDHCHQQLLADRDAKLAAMESELAKQVDLRKRESVSRCHGPVPSAARMWFSPLGTGEVDVCEVQRDQGCAEVLCEISG